MMRTRAITFILLLPLSLFSQDLKLIHPIGHSAPIVSASFSPDGKKILTGSNDNTTKIWDANTATLLANFKEDVGFEQAYYSPDGKKIITIMYKKMIVRDAQTGNLLQTIPFDEMIGISSISPDGTKIITRSSGEISIINAQTGVIQKIIVKDDFLNSASISFDNKQLATTSSLDSIVKIWDIKTGRIIKTLKGHSSTVNAVVFSPKGQYILTVSYDNTAKVWDAKNGTLIHTLSGHTKDIRTGKFSSDEKMVITGSADGTAKIWDTHSGSLLWTLDGNTVWAIDAVNFSPDNKKVIMSSGYTAKIWEVATKTLLNELKGHTQQVTGVFFSHDPKNILTVSDFKTVNVWDKNTGIIKNTWSTNLALERDAKDTKLSTDGRSILTIENDSKTIKNRDIETGHLIFEKPLKSGMFIVVNYSPDGKKIVAALNNDILLILDAGTGSILQEVKDPGIFIESVQFSPNSKTIVTASWDSTAKIWNAETGERLHNLSPHPGTVSKAIYSVDGKKVITVAGSFNQTYVWDAENGKQLHSFTNTAFICFSDDYRTMLMEGEKDSIIIWDIALDKPIYTWWNNQLTLRGSEFIITNDKLIISRGFGGDFTATNMRTGKTMYQLESEDEVKQIEEAVFSADGKQVLTRLYDNTCKIWNSENGKLIYTFFIVDSNDYFLQIPSGYYQATSNASKMLHYVTKDIKVITFEQLDVKYNRPDKVLEAIGNTDTALINSYKRAYEKRIRKLGIDTTQFSDGYSVPEADFVNRDGIEYEQKNERLTLRIKGIDSNYKLDRFNIWVNEVPLFGMKGISIKNRNSNLFDTAVAISLSQGENRIETSITNVNGTESYRMPLNVKYIPAQPVKENVHFIGIGINQFKDNKHNLQWCVKDIRDLAIEFKKKYGDNIIIDTLFDQNVTLSNVQALKQKLLKTSINDKVIIAYSGHGLLSKQYDYYLSSFNVNFSKPEENGIAYEEIENLLDGIPARKKLLLLDACHSGEVDKEEMLVMQTAKTKAGNKGLIMNRGSEEETTETKTVGLQNSFELMQSLFVNVGKGTGTTIISAAGGVQFAQERNELRNGVFTYSLLEALNANKTIKVSELKKYVGQRVEQLTNGMQKPTTRNELKDFDWNVW